jgi:hypothetical protein
MIGMMEMSIYVNNTPWCAVRKSKVHLPVEWYGHCGTVLRVITMRAVSSGLYGKSENPLDFIIIFLIF